MISGKIQSLLHLISKLGNSHQLSTTITPVSYTHLTRRKRLIYVTMSKSQRGYNSISIIYKNLYVKTVRNLGQMLKTKHHQN